MLTSLQTESSSKGSPELLPFLPSDLLKAARCIAVLETEENVNEAALWGTPLISDSF